MEEIGNTFRAENFIRLAVVPVKICQMFVHVFGMLSWFLYRSSDAVENVVLVYAIIQIFIFTINIYGIIVPFIFRGNTGPMITWECIHAVLLFLCHIPLIAMSLYHRSYERHNLVNLEVGLTAGSFKYNVVLLPILLVTLQTFIFGLLSYQRRLDRKHTSDTTETHDLSKPYVPGYVVNPENSEANDEHEYEEAGEVRRRSKNVYREYSQDDTEREKLLEQTEPSHTFKYVAARSRETAKMSPSGLEINPQSASIPGSSGVSPPRRDLGRFNPKGSSGAKPLVADYSSPTRRSYSGKYARVAFIRNVAMFSGLVDTVSNETENVHETGANSNETENIYEEVD